MDAKDAITSSMNMGLFVLERYVDDLGDADLLRRPHPKCNHLAWQLGHLITSEAQLINMAAPGQGADLPEDFTKNHSRDNIASDDPAQFRAKQDYLDLYRQVRQRSLAALAALPEADLAAPGPEAFRNVFPTMLDLWNLIATHPLMHAGQFVIVRRELGKPIVI